MLLQSLRLKNIRSYVDEQIEFPQGIVLLAGDIGAGKSTILLAIEFALFGLLRGDLSGAALLRNGAREGLVEFTFELNGKKYVIGRTLKRTKTSVEQDAGYIVDDGLRREATAIELKTTVLNLLGYPNDLITKSKSLIYRYTVYTPQEEMKKIIIDDKESRLMILRKVFDIEKYRRISDNAGTYAKILRERKRTYEGQLIDEPAKKQQLQEKQQQATTIQQALLTIQPMLNAARQAVAQHKAIVESLDAERTALAQHRATLEAADTEIKTLNHHRNQLQSEFAQVQGILAQGAPPAPTALQDLAQMLREKQSKLTSVEQDLQKHIAARAELIALRAMNEETIKKIVALNECPLCLQQVEATHKHALAEKEQHKASTLLTKHAQAEEALRKNECVKKLLLQEIQTLQQQQAAVSEAHLRHQHYQHHVQRHQHLEHALAQLQQALAAAETRKTQAASVLQGKNALEERFLAEKQKRDAALQQEQSLIIEHTKLLEHAKHLRDMIALLEHDLTAKQQARAQLDKLGMLHQWVDTFFTGLMATMEKHVFTKVYHDFNSLFQHWFSLLIEDEVLLARLDEEFSPIVQQNGYDTEVSNLSGGEKTACALAYRLALNKVINELHSAVQTKDVVILDEPTDGFSADQLDRMRDVLEQLHVRQIILVSHEAMIESLADHVLKVVKEGHTSTILAESG